MIRRAFTMVEILVVIGVLATLLGVLLPAVSSARGSARGTECQSNLRQLGIAATAYCAQNADRYPAALLYKMQTEGLTTIAWDFQTHANGAVTPGALWSFINGADRVQQCPEFMGASTFGNDPFTGYNYNTTYIGAEGRFPSMDPASGRWIDGWKSARLSLSVGKVARTSSCALRRMLSRTIPHSSLRARKRFVTKGVRTSARLTDTRRAATKSARARTRVSNCCEKSWTFRAMDF